MLSGISVSGKSIIPSIRAGFSDVDLAREITVCDYDFLSSFHSLRNSRAISGSVHRKQPASISQVRNEVHFHREILDLPKERIKGFLRSWSTNVSDTHMDFHFSWGLPRELLCSATRQSFLEVLKHREI